MRPVIIFVAVITFVGADTVPSPVNCAKRKNEEFAIDLSRCQNTCDLYGRKWQCPSYYKPKGDCYCKDGYARITKGGKCVSVKNNADCAAQLPVQKDSCTGPNEQYSEFITIGDCDLSCSTFLCQSGYPKGGAKVQKWSPNCECKSSYKRLSNGTCVFYEENECIAEYRPSPERCAVLGQVYTVNPPCQQGCQGSACPPAGGACVCPPGQLYDNVYGVVDFVENVMIHIFSCVSECPPMQ